MNFLTPTQEHDLLIAFDQLVTLLEITPDDKKTSILKKRQERSRELLNRIKSSLILNTIPQIGEESI